MSDFKSTPYASLKFPEFKYFLTIRLFTTIAFSIQFLVVEWKVYALTNNPLHLGFIGLAEIIPAVGFSFISGYVIEKSEKRNSLIYCIISSIIISLLISYILKDNTIKTIGETLFLIILYSLIFMFGAVRAFFTPSQFSLFSLILPKNLYPNGTTWSSSAWQIGAVLGPALGGLLYGLINASYTIWVSTFLLILSFFALLKIEQKDIFFIPKESITESLSQGFRFILDNKVVFSALTLDLIAVLFGGAVALLPVFAKDILHTDSFGLGVLRAAPSLGAIITMVIITYFPILKNTGYKLLIFVFLFGISIIAFGLSKWFWISFTILVLSGIFDGVSVVIRSTILQVLTPDDMRSRVSAVNSMFVGSSNELGAFESGVTAKLMGAVNAVVMGGIITLTVVIWTYITKPELKNYHIN